MSDGFQINVEEVHAASNRFASEAVPEASTARENVTTLHAGQAPSAKWGVQSGSLAFQSAYRGYLDGLGLNLTVLQQELDDFATALALTADSYQATDQSAADAVQTLRANYEELTEYNREYLGMPYVSREDPTGWRGVPWDIARSTTPVPLDVGYTNDADPVMPAPGGDPGTGAPDGAGGSGQQTDDAGY